MLLLIQTTYKKSKLPRKNPSVAGVEGRVHKDLWKNSTTSKTQSSTTDEIMSTYTRRRHSRQGQNNNAGKRQAQHGVVPGRRADGVDQPFPNKPVGHRRPFNPTTQDSLDLSEFEKITITKQPRGPLEHPSNGIRQTTASQHPRKHSQGLSRGELQIDKEIYTKKLMLQEKLWRVEEKIREKIQRDRVEAAAGDEQKNEEERHNRGKAQTKTRQSREPVRGREMMVQERRQEDVKQLRKRQDQRNDDRMKNTHEEERATWKRREAEVAPLQRKEISKGSCEKVHRQEVSEEVNRSRWENVKNHTRRKRGDEKDKGTDGTEKATEREQNTTSTDDKGRTREKIYRERTCKEMYGSDDVQHLPQMSQQKMSHRAATENHRGAGRTPSGEPQLPPVSSPPQSCRPEQGELRLTDSTDTTLQRLPCRICNRKFASNRLEKHFQVCKTLKESHRQVFNSYLHRTKGSAIEEFFKTHTRSKTPEVLKKKNRRQNHKANTRNPHEGRLPAGTSRRSK